MKKLKAYKDGNNNTWEFDAESAEYRAVSNLNSSSASYNGGNNKKIKLSPEQFLQLEQLADDAYKEITAHLYKRLMGSALLIFEDNQLIISMNAPAKLNIDNFLKQL